MEKETPEETNGRINGMEPINACESDNIGYYGLTKREYFAAMAMQGLLSSALHGYTDKIIANQSISLADELLKQLSK